MVKYAIMAALPAVAVVAGLIALKKVSAWRQLTFTAGILLALPFGIGGNILVHAAAASGMLPVDKAWYVQIGGVPLITLVMTLIFTSILRKIAGREALQEELPPVLEKLTAFFAVGFSTLLICAVLLLPLATSPFRQILPAWAAPAAVPALKAVEYASALTMKKCHASAVAAETFQLPAGENQISGE